MFSKYKYHLVVLAAGFCYSTYAVFAKLLALRGVDIFNQIFWRSLFASLFGLVLAVVLGKMTLAKVVKIDARQGKYILINTLIYLGSSATFIGSVVFGTPVAKATILSYAYPLTVVAASWLLLRELPKPKNWLAIFLSLASLAILLEFWTIKNLSSLSGSDLLALGTSFFFGVGIVWLTKIRKESGLNSFQTMFHTMALALPIVLVFALIFQPLFAISILPVRTYFSPSSWLIFAAFGLVATTLPMAFIQIGGAKLKAYVSSVLLLAEPVGTYALGVLLFGQQLSPWAILGAIGISISVLLT